MRVRILAWILVLVSSLSGYVTTQAANILEVPAVVTDVPDGDTITVQIELEVTVRGAKADGRDVRTIVPILVQIRLVDLSDKDNPQPMYAPELSERGGRNAMLSLRRKCLDEEGTLLVNLDQLGENHYIPRLFTFGRLLADFHVPGYVNTVSRRQVLSGHGFHSNQRD